MTATKDGATIVVDPLTIATPNTRGVHRPDVFTRPTVFTRPAATSTATTTADSATSDNGEGETNSAAGEATLPVILPVVLGFVVGALALVA
jgi:hypothetical protein